MAYILQLTGDITDSFEKEEYTLRVFIDLSKAFDTVDHQTLIKRWQYYGIDGTALEWFKRYLSNRKQYTSSQDVSESCLDIICSFPQGSILGPLLFLIYVNDLIKSSNPLMEVMFADDTNILFPIKTFIHYLLVWMWNLTMSQRGLNQTNCLWMLIN